MQCVIAASGAFSYRYDDGGSLFRLLRLRLAAAVLFPWNGKSTAQPNKRGEMFSVETLLPRAVQAGTDVAGAPKVVVASPKGESGIISAYRIGGILRKFNKNTEVLIDPEPDLLYSCTGPVVLIGNLADSSCVKELYHKFLCVTDLWYPGPRGYELRTLIDPFNTGYNLIHLGYSEEQGLAEAEKILEAKIKAGTIPYLREIRAARLHFPESKAQQLREDKIDRKDPTIYLTAGIDEKAYVAYMTGEKRLLNEYYACWEALLKLKTIHLMLYKKAVVWRLLEINGMIPESLRGRLVNFFYSWADGREGVGSLDERIYQAPDFPRQNHGLIPALGLLYLSDYFGRFYPELSRPRLWKKKAEAVFEPYCHGSWKPLCDGLCHGWWLSQPALTDFGLFDDSHRYFESGGARKAADCAVAVVNNEGYMPNAGDSDILRQFPGYCLCAAAAYYRDPEYEYVNEMAPFAQRGYCGPITYPPRSFAVGISGRVPEDKTGITVIPVDPIVYHAWENEPDIAGQAVDTPPAAGIDQCFDKLVMRAGWGKDDDYLLLDGLGGGSHSYSDTMSILDYQRYGVSFIVAEESLHWPEPENHSMVTVYKNGEREKVPGFAELLKVYTDPDKNMYAAMKLKDDNGTDWIREVFLVPGRFVAFHDTVISRTDGDFAIEVHFRMPGTVELNPHGVSAVRQAADGSPVYFTLLSKCSAEAEVSVEKIPLEMNYRTQPGKTPPVSPETDSAAAIRKRYHFSDGEEICLSSFTARVVDKMQRGDSVSFTHVVCASGERREDLPLCGENGVCKVGSGEQAVRLPFQYGRPGAKWSGSDRGKSPGIEVQATAEFDSEICASELMPDGVLCGLKNGLLAKLDQAGKKLWSVQLEGTVHTISCAVRDSDAAVFAGHGENRLSALDGDGKTLWSRQVQRIPTLYPWWELNHPSVVKVKAAVCGDGTYVLAGCGDNHVRMFTADGDLVNAYYYFASVPGIIETADVDQDGEPEAVVAGGIVSADSGVEILGRNHDCMARFASEGWVSRTTAVAVASMNGYSMVACGANHRHNLQLYRFSRPDLNTSGRRQKLDGVRLIYREMAGAVTGIVLTPCEGKLFACTSQGFVEAFDFMGNRLWVKMLQGAATQIVLFQGKIVVADHAGRISVFNSDGGCDKTYCLGSPSPRFHILNDTTNLYLVDNEKIKKLTNESFTF